MKIKCISFTFCECEHSGDLENYADEVRKLPGVVSIKYGSINEDSEEGEIFAFVDDDKKNEFAKAVTLMECNDFIEGMSRAKHMEARS
jgi:hypothetical protein